MDSPPVPIIRSLEDLAEARRQALEHRRQTARQWQVSIATGTCGLAAGAHDVLLALLDEINLQRLEGVVVTEVGCIGLCSLEPLVQVQPPDGAPVLYGKVTPEAARRIVRQHILLDQVVPEHRLESEGELL
jgi:NADP-reducing hydrogenase subunit HndB